MSGTCAQGVLPTRYDETTQMKLMKLNLDEAIAVYKQLAKERKQYFTDKLFTLLKMIRTADSRNSMTLTKCMHMCRYLQEITAQMLALQFIDSQYERYNNWFMVSIVKSEII
jgi:hypothetical protein